jgi:tetratricopeptide (TPR) repeat protein
VLPTQIQNIYSRSAGDLEQAINAVENAVKADPTMEDAYINLGQFYTHAGPGYQQKALENYAMAVKLVRITHTSDSNFTSDFSSIYPSDFDINAHTHLRCTHLTLPCLASLPGTIIIITYMHVLCVHAEPDGE